MISVKRVLINLSATGLICFVLLLISSLSQAQPVSFVVTGDSWGPDNGVNTAILAEMAQATVDEGVDFTLVIGD